MKDIIQCDVCEATSNIEHDMDEELYTVNFCPCCGSNEITKEDSEGA